MSSSAMEKLSSESVLPEVIRGAVAIDSSESAHQPIISLTKSCSLNKAENINHYRAADCVSCEMGEKIPVITA
jgi:hypothetical protein